MVQDPRYIERIKHLNPVERFTDLFSGKDDRLDHVNQLLYEIWLALVGEAPSPDGNGGRPVTPNRLYMRTVDLIKNVAILTTETITPTSLARVETAYRALILVNNGFDQTIRVDILGNNSSSHGSAIVINDVNATAGQRIVYGLKIEEWMPYIGCQITALANPTIGTVNAVAIIQDFSPAEGG